MTTFEIIILILIYCFCYGYANLLLKQDNESRWDIVTRIVASVFIAIYVPMIIGFQIADKLNE